MSEMTRASAALTKRLGIGPIGWVNDDLRHWGANTPGEQVLREIAAAGYAGTERSYRFPDDPKLLKAALAEHGLLLSGAYRWTNLASAEAYEAELEATRQHIDFCRAAGATVANIAEGTGSLHWDLRGERSEVDPLDDAAWERLVAALHSLGRYAYDRGVQLCVHPHAGTPIQYEAEIDRLFASTDPALLHYCADTGHLAYAGLDPVTILRRHAARIRYIHLKDVRADVLASCHADGLLFKDAIQRNCFCTPGSGAIDFGPVLAVLAEAGYDGWLVVEAEQDPALHTPLVVAKHAAAYLRKVAGE